SQSALEAGSRSRAEADAGASRAPFLVQHPGVGAIPHRNGSADGRSHARPLAFLPARRRATASLRQHYLGSGSRACARVSVDHADAHAITPEVQYRYSSIVGIAPVPADAADVGGGK